MSPRLLSAQEAPDLQSSCLAKDRCTSGASQFLSDHSPVQTDDVTTENMNKKVVLDLSNLW